MNPMDRIKEMYYVSRLETELILKSTIQFMSYILKPIYVFLNSISKKNYQQNTKRTMMAF
jgi:hypothetical protein